MQIVTGGGLSRPVECEWQGDSCAEQQRSVWIGAGRAVKVRDVNGEVLA
jgi:hypothetical protein